MSRVPLATSVAALTLLLSLFGGAPTGVRAMPAMGPSGLEFVARSLAGPTAVTDSTGQVWSARDGFQGGTATANGLRDTDVAGTEEDDLYRVSGFQLTGYSMAVPAPGRYQVRLLMAESYWSEAGRRVFDVTAEGAVALAELDIVRAVGRGAAYDPRFEVEVADGRLDVGFVRRVDNPLVAGVEVRSLEFHPPRGDAVRAVAAHQPFVDVLGRTWAAREGWVGPDTVSGDLQGKDVRGTVEDQLYRVSRTAPSGWGAPLLDGRYKVTLLMADGQFWQAGQRVFHVTAQGAPALSNIDIAGAVGKATAYERSFEVDVTGGRLDLAFVPVVSTPRVAAIHVETLPPAAPEPPSPAPVGRAPIPLSAGSPFVTRIEDAPLDPRSAAMAENLRQDVITRYNGVAAVNAYQFNASFYPVDEGQPRVDVAFWDCQSKGYVPWDIYEGEAYFKGVPIPPDARPANGSDGQLAVYDAAADQLWEFWKARRNATTGGWEACWGGRIDNVSGALGVYRDGYGVAANGLAMAAGMISIEEVRRGRIDHSLYLAVPTSQAFPELSWPANRTDGGSTDSPDIVRQGQRLRLDPSLDLEELQLSPVGEMIAEAAQRYGFIVSDTSGAVAVITESGAREAAVTGVDPWKELLGMPSYDVLKGFPWDRIQVVERDYGKP